MGLVARHRRRRRVQDQAHPREPGLPAVVPDPRAPLGALGGRLRDATCTIDATVRGSRPLDRRAAGRKHRRPTTARRTGHRRVQHGEYTVRTTLSASRTTTDIDAAAPSRSSPSRATIHAVGPDRHVDRGSDNHCSISVRDGCATLNSRLGLTRHRLDRSSGRDPSVARAGGELQSSGPTASRGREIAGHVDSARLAASPTAHSSGLPVCSCLQAAQGQKLVRVGSSSDGGYVIVADLGEVTVDRRCGGGVSWDATIASTGIPGRCINPTSLGFRSTVPESPSLSELTTWNNRYPTCLAQRPRRIRR